FFACLVRFESSSVPTTLPTAYDVYPLDGRHDGGYYTVKDCVTIDVLPRTPGNNVYVGFMVWSNFTATKCRGLAFKRPVSSWKALNLRKTLLMASSVRLKPLNCSRLPCVYAQETLTFLL